MNADILRNYQTLATQYQGNFEAKKKQIRLISVGRFICFIGIFPPFYYLNPENTFLAFVASSILLGTFFFLVKKFIETEKQLLFFQRLVQINQDEIKALNRDLSPFDRGTEFSDPHHDYSYDLDLYGNGSLFQFLNRTVTNRGKNKLASLLKQSQRTEEEVIYRQQAIQELSGKLNWRQHYLAKGKETEDQKNILRIDDSIGQLIQLKSVQTIKYLLKILPLLTILLIGLNCIGIFPNSFYLIAIFSQWVIFILYGKTISRFHKKYENQAKRLSRYASMLLQIEKNSFKSSYLVLLKEKLNSKGKKASTITSELQKILNEFDYRQNILVGFVLNSVLLWDLRCLYKLYRWQQNYEGDLPQWFDVIAETDALVSLANCNFNHPEWTTPEITNSGFQFIATEMGHPLIDPSKCVRNSFQISDNQQIAIITGANMAGKSTFLRTVGVNLILAGNGCKVCAKRFEFSPIRIFTNMRTSDNLMNDESYFYAELLRLQTLLTQLRKGENLFVIIDEMLKGTNSTDKLNGSKELINQLISLKTHGIVATHDLGLTELVRKYPDSIKNQCFEVLLQADELKFDYKLSEGVTRTMNATFLMKKMGIIPKC
jgi:DNA mismatch repair ATPase MutS